MAAVAALGVAGIASVGASASKGPTGGHHIEASTITATSNGHNLEFQGDKKVKSGSQLQIVNATDPTQVGPHTFTLVKKSELPTTKQEMKDCEKLQSKLCQDVAKAQKVNTKTFEVKKPVVDAGKKGWDKSFGKRGDTWYTQTEGEFNQRKVRAKPGTTLYYLCVVHPFMQGKIKVVK